LARLTCLFVYGCAADDGGCWMPKSVQHLMNVAPLNWVQLSIKTLLGMPNLYMILCRNLTAASWVIFTADMAPLRQEAAGTAPSKSAAQGVSRPPFFLACTLTKVAHLMDLFSLYAGGSETRISRRCSPSPLSSPTTTLTGASLPLLRPLHS
jgi:hypothetical protein